MTQYNQREIWRRFGWAHHNDDVGGILRMFYNEQNPNPYFDPTHIAFRKLRNFNHMIWNTRETSDRTIIWEDMEFLEVGVSSPWQHIDARDISLLPCKKQDLVVVSCKTDTDYLWPCDYVFNSWHLVSTSMRNTDRFITQTNSRPFFASILLGNEKLHRTLFFEHLQKNNQLEDNLINYFRIYTSEFLNTSPDLCDQTVNNEVRNSTEYVNTTMSMPGEEFANFTSQVLSNYIEENTWISVVGETLFNDSIFFPTEKTGKALMSGKPFIVLSGRYYLRKLRELGFQTFHPVIDETYDEVEGLDERIEAAYNSFIKLKEQDPLAVRSKLSKVLEHNEKCMRNKLWLTSGVRKKLENYICPYPEGSAPKIQFDTD